MHLFYLFFILLIIATYQDIKKREVYEFINYLFLIMVTVYAGIISLQNIDFTLLYIAGLALVGFGAGALFYFSGLWGGGDATYLISIPPLLYFFQGKILNYLPFMPENQLLSALVLTFLYLLGSLTIGGLTAMLVVIYNYLRNIKSVPLENYQRYIILSLFLPIIFILLIPQIDTYFALPLLLLNFLLWLSFITKKVENFMFIKDKDINNIVLGDWIVQDIYVENQKIFSSENFRKGVDENQLAKLKELRRKNKLTNLRVKDGIPFFIGFLVSFIPFLF